MNNNLFYGVFRRRGILLTSLMDGSVHLPLALGEGVVFATPEAAADFAAYMGGDTEIWVLAAKREAILEEFSPDIFLVKGFVPLRAI